MNAVVRARSQEACPLPASLLDRAALVTADPDDLKFTIDTVHAERASLVPLNIEFDGWTASAIVWVRDAHQISLDGESFWILSSRLTDLVSQNQWASGLASECVLVVPIEGDALGTNCFLAEMAD